MKIVITTANIFTIWNKHSYFLDEKNLIKIVTLFLSLLLLVRAAGGIKTSWRIVFCPFFR